MKNAIIVLMILAILQSCKEKPIVPRAPAPNNPSISMPESYFSYSNSKVNITTVKSKLKIISNQETNMFEASEIYSPNSFTIMLINFKTVPTKKMKLAVRYAFSDVSDSTASISIQFTDNNISKFYVPVNNTDTLLFDIDVNNRKIITFKNKIKFMHTLYFTSPDTLDVSANLVFN